MYRFILLITLYFFTGTLKAQHFSDSTQLSLLTCAPGAELYSKFGHSAIRLKDPVSGRDLVYNYGIFDFDTPNFYAKFIRGKLKYMLGLQQTERFVRVYQYEGRTVTEQPLKLSLESKRKLIAFLQTNYRPENRYYLYDFFYDNCATRIRDALATELNIDMQGQAGSSKTYRELLDEYIEPFPWADFGIDLILGLPTDKIAGFDGAMFLPDYLAQNLGTLEIEGTPLTDSSQTLIDYPPQKEAYAAVSFSPLLATTLLLLLGLFFSWRKANKALRWLDIILFTVYFLGGALLLFMWFGTEHVATWQNLNLLWLNPLYLLLLFKKIRHSNLGQLVAWILLISNALCLFGFNWLLPQTFNSAIVPLLLLMIFRLLAYLNIFSLTGNTKQHSPTT